ncbi:hypothetical protein J421_6101 (plasmid) [Gemmatirosa kalamazoonensis]|uniref:Uncharacterized protein n=1 Tax=Gemmatirosa kalamazoonensis TaxID=861299 RepID=W0RSG1_9BACT|nr:hypothetical protein [Gemmatirosa kalamazoonensis]AHG93636.1 hypothetical protein J421_6101 [Gemmatirosa kalamazoonensis]
MSKDDAVRLTDTIAFIRGAAVPPVHQAKRATVADILRDRDNAGQISSIISPAMSQGANWAVTGRDEAKDQRHYRRALILIRSVLLGVDRNTAALEAGQITDAAALPAALGNTLADVTGLIDDCTAKLAELKAHPLTFLSRNKLQVAGMPTSSQCTYNFYFDRLNDTYNFSPPNSVANWVNITEPVYQLHVQQYAGLARAKTVGDDSRTVVGNMVHGADLMVTTQLTGCAVVYYRNGASLIAAHVQPGAANAEAMCTDLRANARLTLAPAITGIFGAQNPKGVDPNNYLKAGFYNYCIGVRHGGSWDLYAQQRPRSYGDAIGAAIDSWKIT